MMPDDNLVGVGKATVETPTHGIESLLFWRPAELSDPEANAFVAVDVLGAVVVVEHRRDAILGAEGGPLNTVLETTGGTTTMLSNRFRTADKDRWPVHHLVLGLSTLAKTVGELVDAAASAQTCPMIALRVELGEKPSTVPRKADTATATEAETFGGPSDGAGVMGIVEDPSTVSHPKK